MNYIIKPLKFGLFLLCSERECRLGSFARLQNLQSQCIFEFRYTVQRLFNVRPEIKDADSCGILWDRNLPARRTRHATRSMAGDFHHWS